MDEFTNQTSTEEAIKLAKQLNTPESKGELVIPQASQIASAVFQEPIITAQPCRVKRDVPAFLLRMKVLAQMGGEDYCYRWQVKNKDGSKSEIKGPTITLANDLVREYMNCMVDVRVVENEKGTHDIFYARFIDYETGFCMTRPFKQRRTQSLGKFDADRQADIAFQIGASKAIRNVVVNALRTFADFTFREAEQSLISQIGRDLAHWISKMKRGIEEKGYDLKLIEAQIGNPIDKWLAADIARVIAELKSIADGMAIFDDLYPDPTKQPANADDLNKEFLGHKEEKTKKESKKKSVEPEKKIESEAANKGSYVPVQIPVNTMEDDAMKADWMRFVKEFQAEIKRVPNMAALKKLFAMHSSPINNLQRESATLWSVLQDAAMKRQEDL